MYAEVIFTVEMQDFERRKEADKMEKCKKCGKKLGYENGEVTVCINKDCENYMLHI